MWTNIASNNSETAYAEEVGHRKAATTLQNQNDLFKGGHPAHGAVEEAVKVAQGLQSLSCSSADYSKQNPLVLEDPVNNSACVHDYDTDRQDLKDVSVGTRHLTTPERLNNRSPVIRDQQAGETAVHPGVPQRSGPRDSVGAVIQVAATQKSYVLGNTGEGPVEEGLVCSGSVGGNRNESTSKSRIGCQIESGRLQEKTMFKHGNGEATSSTLCVHTDPGTAPALREPPQVHSETLGRTRKPPNRADVRDLGVANSGGAMVTVALETGKGYDRQEPEEECLRRILCELNRQELECMQERMQRSLGYLLETQKEKQAEQLTLLQERRRLDATLAHAQKLLIQYTASNNRASRQPSTSSSVADSRKMSTAPKLTHMDPLLITTGASRPRTPVSPLHVCGRGRSIRGEVVSAEKKWANMSTPPPPESPLQRGKNRLDFAHHSDIREKPGPSCRLEELQGEGDESILADLFGDLLHRYGPAAVKGVGAAAHRVKEGLGVLRQELLALQQHQQATEKQRAIEKHARYMLRLEEEMEYVQHQRLVQHLQNLHVYASSDSGQPCVCSSVERMVAAGVDLGGAKVARANVNAGVSDHASQCPDKGKPTSSVSVIPGSASTSYRSARECTHMANGSKRLSYIANARPPDAYIRTTGKSRIFDAVAAEACEVRQRVVQVQQQLCDGPALQNDHFRGHAAASCLPIEIRATAVVTDMSDVMKPANPAPRNYHSVQDDHVTIEKNLLISGESSCLSSVKPASSSIWRALCVVEGKSTPRPCHFSEYRLDVEKCKTEGEAPICGKKRSAPAACSSPRCSGQAGGRQPNLPLSRCSASASVNLDPLVSSALPSAYRTLGTRKERLQRTAASLDSLSRGVVDAVGSVKHTVARWFFASENLSEAAAENGAVTCKNTATDSTTASCPSRGDCVIGQNPFRLEPSFLSVKGTNLHVDHTSTILESSPAAAMTAPVAKQSGQEDEQLNLVKNSEMSQEKGELPAKTSLEATSTSEETARNSSVFSATVRVTDVGVADKMLGTTEEQVFAASAERAVEECRTDTALQAENMGEGRQEERRGGRTAALTESPSANAGTRHLARAPSNALPDERQGGETLRMACTTGSVVLPASAMAKRAQSIRDSNDSHGGARDEFPPSYRKVSTCFIDTEGAPVKVSTDEGECPAEEQDPAVIEAFIRVGGKNGMVPLPLVVLATEQCRDIAEEWVDRHWVQLQQTQFWLMRGKAGANEAVTETGYIRASVAGNDSCDPSAAGKRNNEAHSSELSGEKGIAGRVACGGGSAKTTFLTRSRAIHSLAAFLGHAEATSESLPVRVVEDWENIIRSPSADTMRMVRQQTCPKIFGQT